MKILTIAATPYFSDRGCHIRVFSEAKYLQKKGAENTLCTYHLGKDVGDFKIKRIGKVNWYKKTSPGFAWGKIWLDLKLLSLCVREMKNNQIDTIHAHLYEGLVIGWLAKYLTGSSYISVVLDLQGDLKGELENYNKKSNSIVKSILIWTSDRALNLATAVIISSENVLESISKKFKDEKNVFVIKDGVDIDLFKNNTEKSLSLEAKAELKEIKKWKGNGKVLIYTGGMEEGKGLRELLKEFLKINNELKNWKLVLYGQGSEREAYQKNINESASSNSVWLVKENGFFSLPHFLKIADVSIDPKNSSSESSGKLMNYMAANLPIICFDNKFNRERLLEKGLYIKKVSDLKNILNNFKTETIKYNLNKESAEIQAEKLFGIFKDLIAK